MRSYTARSWRTFHRRGASIRTDGGTWPWNLAPAPPPAASRPVTIPGYVYPSSTTAGVVVSPAARRAVVLVAERVKDEEKMTRVLWCDTAAGTVLREWRVKGIYAPLDLHADGHRLLTVRPPGEGPTQSLELWAIEDPDRLRRQSWQPHDSVDGLPIGGALAATDTPESSPNDAGRDVRWAAFVGNRVVSASRAGQLRVFDAATLERAGTIDGVPATPALTPDGSRVVFLTKSGAALLDPAGPKVVGVRPVEGPADPVLAVSPDGKSLACAANGRVALLDLAGGQVRTATLPKLEVARSGRPLGFGWAGDRHLLADRFLHDPTAPAPVWDYGSFDKLLPRGREAWAVLRPARDSAVLRSFVLPHPAVGGAKAANRPAPGRSTLQPDGIADAAR